MPGHSGSKNGVASLAYLPGIHALLDQKKAWMAGTSPAMTAFDSLRLERALAFCRNPLLRKLA
jgi:hypothetical protein